MGGSRARGSKEHTLAIAVSVTSNTGGADPSAGLDSTRTSQTVEGTLTLTGSYGTSSSHGDTVNFAIASVMSDLLPKKVEVWESPAAGTAALGYIYIFCPGTTLANGVLQIIGTGTASQDGGNEITEGAAYSGQSPSLAGAVLHFKAWFCKSV